MSEPTHLWISRYSLDGDPIELARETPLDAGDGLLVFWRDRFRHLSFDLELPLEVEVPELPGTMVQVSSQPGGAYLVYYHQEVAVFASMVLAGVQASSEQELLDVFRFLLLDPADEDEELEESRIDEILTAPEFSFQEVSQRPAVFQIEFESDTGLELAALRTIDQRVAAAFVERAGEKFSVS